MSTVSITSTPGARVSGSAPLVVIGAGPVGLAAAANAADRGLPFVVLEAGPVAGAAVAEWAHVRLFSAWSELVDPTARKLLEATGWEAPDLTDYPSGGAWREEYLQPLADALDAHPLGEVRYGTRVVGVARRGRDRVVSSGRDAEPFVIYVVDADGGEGRVEASAVIDASGTWTQPNPLGSDGYPAVGEAAHADHIHYGIPDFRDPAVAARYAGKHVALAGKGASAQGVLVGLGRLAQEDPGTRVSWLLRRPSVGDAFGGGDNDQLPERGALGKRARRAAEGGHVATVTQFRTSEVRAQADGRLTIGSTTGAEVVDVDEVIVVTGFRPDHSFLSELRLDLDPVLGSVRALADQIDPSFHSCGDVAPHGHRELAQPESNLFLVGMKSYGRAPSFLAMTGYEQVRSVVAALDGDLEAADKVELVLPETGVCNGSGRFDDEVDIYTGASECGTGAASAGGCCGPAVPAGRSDFVSLETVTTRG
jgi:NADPH-dependent 2,4-dienoyl-CoA reductase/sulfur reductase-like enzyme